MKLAEDGTLEGTPSEIAEFLRLKEGKKIGYPAPQEKTVQHTPTLKEQDAPPLIQDSQSVFSSLRSPRRSNCLGPTGKLCTRKIFLPYRNGAHMIKEMHNNGKGKQEIKQAIWNCIREKTSLSKEIITEKTENICHGLFRKLKWNEEQEHENKQIRTRGHHIDWKKYIGQPACSWLRAKYKRQINPSEKNEVATLLTNNLPASIPLLIAEKRAIKLIENHNATIATISKIRNIGGW